MAICLPLKTKLRGYTEAEAQTLSVSERRRRTSTRVGYVARVIYLGIQLLCITILLHSDSQLGQSWRTPSAAYAWSYLALMLLNLLLYIALCTSNPGYLAIRDADEETAPLNTNPAAQQAGKDAEEVQSERSGYGPLPYPTNYANYINLDALGRSTAGASGTSFPWWDLPNPGL